MGATCPAANFTCPINEALAASVKDFAVAANIVSVVTVVPVPGTIILTAIGNKFVIASSPCRMFFTQGR